MKRIVLVLLLIVAIVAGASADIYTINRDRLPEVSREWLDTYFPKAKVSMIKVDKHFLRKTDYDVKLTNGTKIEFNNKGKWTSVDCVKKAVPGELVPKTVKNYVGKNYPDALIVKIIKKSGGHIITLSDGTELKFNALGKMVKVLADDAVEEEEEESTD